MITTKTTVEMELQKVREEMEISIFQCKEMLEHMENMWNACGQEVIGTRILGVNIYPDLDAWAGITCMVVKLNTGFLALSIIDTGAVTCIIGKAGLELIKGREIKQEGEKPRLLSASSERLEVKGMIDVEMIVGIRSDVSRFFVVEQFSGDFILGTDFLRKRKAVVDFQSETMTWTTFAGQAMRAKLETGDKSAVIKKIDDHNSRWTRERNSTTYVAPDRLMASITRNEWKMEEPGDDQPDDVVEGQAGEGRWW